jgi:membrane protease YdiL (CAAX protease family)
MIVIYNALFIAFLLWRGGAYSPARSKPRWVRLEIAGVFALGFLANAWRSYLIGQHAPEPARSISVWVLTLVSVGLPVTAQLIRKRPLSELGIALNLNWRVLLTMVVWIGILVVATVAFRMSQRLYLVAHPDLIASVGFGLLGEELLYRGFLQTRLETLVGTARGWIPASLLFGLTHVAMVFVKGPAVAVYAMVQTAVLGALWGIAFAKNRTLLVVWPAHALYDLVPGGILFG